MASSTNDAGTRRHAWAGTATATGMTAWRWAACGMAGFALLVSACASRVPPVVTTPAYPSYVFPTVPPAYEGTPAAERQRAAWAFLQSGDVEAAGRRFSNLLSEDRAFFPAAAGLGWVELAQSRFVEAVAYFDTALGSDDTYVPAWLGRAAASLARDDPAEALRSYEAAHAVTPTLDGVERRIGELRLQVMTDRLDRARRLHDAGDIGAAESAYRDVIAASPESAFLYLELARLYQQRGAVEQALAETRRAQALDDGDPAAHLLEGELLETTGSLTAAAEAYRRAEMRGAGDPAVAALTRVRAALRESDLPVPYGEIETRPEVTRGDVAALLGVRLADLLEDAAFGASPPIFTDARDHWANPWILEVTRAGIMHVDARYRFEPDQPVSRGGLAEIVADVLAAIGEFDPETGRTWQDAQVRFGDLPESHLSYRSASVAVAAGIMQPTASARFEPARIVTGREAVDVVDRLARLAGRTR